MTRFWLTLDQGVRFVVRCIEAMHGGEIFVPKIPSMKLVEMAEALAPGCEVEYMGIRPGEKLHEVLISEDEARNGVEVDDMFVIQPAYSWWQKENWSSAQALPDGFRYASDTNPQWMTSSQLQELVEASAPAKPRLIEPQKIGA
jgi:UDP-N-acetylglucosamine 4,6-dehydratase